MKLGAQTRVKRYGPLLTGLLFISVPFVGPGCVVHPIPILHDAVSETRFVRHSLRGKLSGTTTILHRSNYLSDPVEFQPGSKVEFRMFSAVRIDMHVEGIPCQMFSSGGVFPSTKEGLDTFLEKHFARSKEELKLDTMEASVLRAIEDGTGALGMTKEDLLFTLGYPARVDHAISTDNLTREEVLKSNQWVYRYGEVFWIPTVSIYQFNDKGKLVRIIR